MTKIPEGFHSVTPYIIFDDTAAAIDFYKKALGADEKIRLPAPEGGVMYAELQIGNSSIMMGDPSSQGKEKSAKQLGGSPVSFYVYVKDVEAAFKKAKDAGMAEKKAIEDMFWGDRIGTLTDPFNIEWTLAQHVNKPS